MNSKSYDRKLIKVNIFKITGAGSGIGRELALQLAELGATIICWDKDERRNNALVEEIRKKDGDVSYTLHIIYRSNLNEKFRFTQM